MKTKYQKLVETQKKYCEGKILKTPVNEAAKSYVDDAVSKGKDAKEARDIAARVTSTCSVNGTKKKKRKVSGVGATKKKSSKPKTAKKSTKKSNRRK